MGDSAFVQEIPSQRPNTPFKTYIRFPSLNHAQLLASYWRLVILVDNMLRELSRRLSLGQLSGLRGILGERDAESELAHELQTKYAAQSICKSLEFCLEFRPLGPASMLYNLVAATSERHDV